MWGGGGRGTRVPSQHLNFLFSCSFRQKTKANNSLTRPLWEILDQPLSTPKKIRHCAQLLRNLDMLLPAATKLGQGNVFTGICDSVHRGGCLPQCMLGCQTTPPRPGTPLLGADPPGPGTPPPDQTPPPRKQTPAYGQ